MSDPTAASTVVGLLRSTAERVGSRPALLRTDGQVVCHYDDLVERVGAIGAWLRAAGVTPGNAVMVTVTSAPEMLVAILGAMDVGACAPMNPAYTEAELADLADQLHPRAAIVFDGQGGRLERVAEQRDVPCLRLTPGGHVAGATAPGEDGPIPGPSDVALILHTAGTTAKPKQVPLTHANLVAAAHNVVTSVRLTPEDRCLNVMPLFHSHGLLGAALSTIAAGGSIVCANGMDPRRFLGWAVDTGCNWYTAAATIHHLVLDAPGEWPGLRFMRSASAPLAPQVASGLEARFGAPMIEVYGMTEAYQIAANPLPPGERRLGSVGPPSGTEIAIADDHGEHQPPGTEGEVIVRGPAVFVGYSSPPGANETAFFGDWFRTGDLGRLSDDGYLTITGRIKEQINRGGEKIAPREVDEAVLAHPDVLEAMAFAIPDAQLGEEVGVAVVAQPGTAPDATSIRTFLHGRIAPFKVPRRVVVVDELPKSSTGKYQRIGFADAHADLLTATTPSGQPDVSDDGSLLARLAAIWAELLELGAPPSPDDRFFDLGGTSLLTMELVARIEADLGVDLPVVDVIDVPALGEMAARIEAVMTGGHHSPLLRRYRTGTTGQRIVLIPGQFGMALGLNLIADAIDADVDVYMFDYPGNRPGEQPLRSVEALAACLVDELKREGITEQLAMYGNSMGGWVAFEAARTLTADGSPPLFVGIGDMYSPFFNTKDSPLRPSFGRRVRNRVRRLRLARDHRRQRDSAAAASTNRQQAVVAASEAARREYTPKPYPGELLVVMASEREPQFGRTLGWERHASGPIHTIRVDAQHSNMHITEATVIGQRISERLQSSERRA